MLGSLQTQHPQGHRKTPALSRILSSLLAIIGSGQRGWAQVLCGFGPAAPPLYALTSFPENLG